ncbi:MAG: M6 family metalloprotease domain-containing protein [Bacteroidaceae bacterium]|nr:M6 family metalloprotease domain-containing protein [Bacteroidaceae bacterium]
MKLNRISILVGMLAVALSAMADVKPRPILNGKQGLEAREAMGIAMPDPNRRMNEAARMAAAKALERPMATVGLHALAPLASQGTPKVPVVLVEFSDLHFTANGEGMDANSYFDLYCNGTRNGENYTGAGSYGSVRDYFIYQSDSIFQPEFVIIGPVVLSESYKYYGKNSGSRKDVNIKQFYSDAIKKAQELIPNWNVFDNNNDGIIDMAYFIYAGEGENGCDDDYTIWPKESSSGDYINGIEYGAFACCNELYGDVADGIGVMCHELSHALGLPDLYDTNYKMFGMDYWDIMDSGCYCKNGYQPCGYSAYEKDFMQWTSLITLDPTEGQDLTLRPISEGGQGYKLVNPENSNEYYIIENRQNTSWDEYIGRGSKNLKHHGMLAIHVDYSQMNWTNNTVNTSANHQRFTIVPADSILHSYMFVDSQEKYNEFMYSINADPYPGRNNTTSLLPDRMTVYTTTGETPGQLNQPLTEITEHEDGTITLKYCGGAPAPIEYAAEDVNRDGKVNATDVMLIYNYILASSSPEVATDEPCDVNKDGKVNATDVMIIYNYILAH